jgi:hypothetical protein
MEKIKVEDLGVGSWVRVRMCKCDYGCLDTLDAKVLSIVGNSVGVGYDNSGVVMSAFVDDLQPIHITAEVLEKNEFKKNGEYNEWNIGTWRTPYLLGVSLERPAITIKWNGNSVFIDQAKYVHQLQHALRLVGVGKEITL